MELRVLEYFLALAREGSVSAAAAALHVSQPTLSRQLMDLERELGATLFERGRHGVTLTEEGLLLRRRAAEIVGLAGVAASEVARASGVVAGEVRVGCAETRAVRLLADVMRAVRARHPQVTFRVTSGLAEDVAEQIGRGLLDFGLLLRMRPRWGLASVRLPSQERAVVVMRRDDPLASRGRLRTADLAGRPLLVPASWRENGILGDALPRSAGGDLDVVAEFDLPFNASQLVRAGMGCAVVLDGLMDTPPGGELVARPLDVPLDMPSYLAWQPRQRRTRACEAFLAQARAAFGEGEGGASG